MNAFNKSQVPILFATFALLCYLYHNEKNLTLPIELIAIALIVVVLVKVLKSDNVS